MLCRKGRTYSLFSPEFEVSSVRKYWCQNALIPLRKKFNFTRHLLWTRDFSSPDHIKYVLAITWPLSWLLCLCSDIFLSRSRYRSLRKFLQDLGVECALRDAYNIVIRHCATLHAADYSTVQNACLRAKNSILYSPHLLASIIQELAHMLYSPDDAVIFDENRLDRIFNLLFEHWFGIETYIPEFRVSDYMPLYSHRCDEQKSFLCVIQCLELSIFDPHNRHLCHWQVAARQSHWGRHYAFPGEILSQVLEQTSG